MGCFRKQIRISLHFLALSFIQLLELQEATVLRLVWMIELPFLTSPSDNDTSSTYFQVQDSGSEILKLLTVTRNNIGLRNAGIYWEPVRDRASQLNARSAVRQKAYNPRY